MIQLTRFNIVFKNLNTTNFNLTKFGFPLWIVEAHSKNFTRHNISLINVHFILMFRYPFSALKIFDLKNNFRWIIGFEPMAFRTTI
jgi:hypothetical protein